MAADLCEIEVKLIIRSEYSRMIARQIARLEAIGSLWLIPQAPKRMEDQYFDTPDGSLEIQRLALRARKIGRRTWITLKGPTATADWGGGIRSEIEAMWSKEAMTRVISELRNRGMEIVEPCSACWSTDPINVMTSYGFEAIQERKTHRTARSINGTWRQRGDPLAELVIDCVTYYIGGAAIHHREIEIEAVECFDKPLITITEYLTAMYGPLLQRWEHSKLATGKALAGLHDEGALGVVLDREGNLRPESYDLISAYLMSVSH